jgi:hypothetical protein
MEFAVRKLSPKTLIRYASTSRAARESTTLERKRIAALKRFVHRLALRHNARFFNQRFPSNPRLASPLFRARIAAHARARMSPARKQESLARTRWQAARNAYGRYVTRGYTNENWNRFLRVHAKRGLSPINHRAAARMYN